MSLLPETHSIQSKLASYCRNGIEVDLPGVTPNRLHQYRRLVFNIIQDNLEFSFPIAYEYLANDSWKQLVYDFFSSFDCQSYQIWQFPREFYEFVVKENYAEKLQLPYLNDLLKFEWTEMEIYNMEDIPYPSYIATGDSLNDVLVINPEFKILQFNFPVHKQIPTEALHNPGNYFVLIYREKDSGKVQFVELSVWFALLIEQIHQNGNTLTELLAMAPQLFGEIDQEELTKNTLAFISEMQQKQFIMGVKTKRSAN